MLIALVLGVGAAVVGLARGGSLESLSATRLRWLPLLLIGLVTQIVFDYWSPPWLTRPVVLAVIVASNVAVAGFIFANREIPGMLLAGVGLMLNLIVIIANGAMPVSDEARHLAQVQLPLAASLRHEAMTSQTVLPWLADVIPLPRLREVLSVGDLVLAAGITRLIYYRTTVSARGRHLAPRG